MKSIVATAPTAVLAVVLLLGAWLLFAPAQLGGATRYAVVEGASMEPGLSRGDLVVVRAEGEPTVGDVVLYRDATMGVRVLHRVTDIEGGRLVLRGDANDFVDDTRPRPSEVVGTYWFSVPRAGAVVLWLAEPLHAALLAFVLTLVALAGGGARETGRERGGEPGVNVSASTRAATLTILPLTCFLGVAFGASTIVPASNAGRELDSITVNELKPAACSAVTLGGIRTGTGVISDGGASNLVLGSAAVDTMRGNGGNDCLVGGGAIDSLRGDGGTDVCIGGPGLDTFHVSCETQIQ
jgi:signal peptidase I